MRISLIVAMDSHRVIGNNGGLPWHLPYDLQRFKKITMGKPIVMGRKTHASIGRPLPGRENIILTRDSNYKSDGCTVLNTTASIFDYCHEHEEIMIAGGADIYRMFVKRAQRVYLTEVHAEVAGDAYFTAFNIGDWKVVSREDFQADSKNEYDFSFLILDRK